MKEKEVTPLDYARWRGCTLQNITKHLRKGNLAKLPGVLMVKKYSRFYVLVVAANWGKSSYKALKVKK